MSQSSQVEEKGDSNDGQTNLFNDTIYEHNSKNTTPEDIIREFEIPEDTALKTLDLSAETIIERTTLPWEVARETFSGSDPGYTPPEDGNTICSVDIKADVFDIFISHMGAVVDELKLYMTEEGWYISFTGQRNVQLAEIWIDKSEFENYSVSHETVVGIPLRIFENTLKHVNRDQTLSITFETDDVQPVAVIEDGFTTTCSLIDPDSIRQCPNLPMSGYDHTTHITLPGVDLKHLSKAINNEGDTVSIHTHKNDKVSFKTATDDDSSVYEKTYQTYKDLTEYRERSITQYNFDIAVSEETVSLYSIEFLYGFFNHQNTMMRTDYEIDLGDNVPMNIKRNISEKSFIRSTIAPKIKQ